MEIASSPGNSMSQDTSMDDLSLQITAQLSEDMPKIKVPKKKKVMSILAEHQSSLSNPTPTPVSVNISDSSNVAVGKMTPTLDAKTEPGSPKSDKQLPKERLTMRQTHSAVSSELQPIKETKKEHKINDDFDSDDDSDFGHEDVSVTTVKPVSVPLQKMTRLDSSGINYTNTGNQDPMVDFMIKVANSLKVKADLYEQFKECIAGGVGTLQKQMSKAVSKKLGKPKIAELAEITQIFQEYQNDQRLKPKKPKTYDDDGFEIASQISKETEDPHQKAIQAMKFELQKARIQLNMMVIAFRRS